MKATLVRGSGAASRSGDDPEVAGGVTGLGRLVDPRRSSQADRCVIWLTLGLVVYVPYLWRVNYLLAHPTIEPYFDRGTLAFFATCLTGVVVLSLILIVYLLLRGGRDTERSWILVAATQIHFVWIAIAAYAVGPLTTPILGLLIAVVFIAALLFSSKIVVQGLVSALVILMATTIAERLGLLAYAPLFLGSPFATGRLNDAYVIGTGLASVLTISSTSMVAVYLVGRNRTREEELLVANRAQEETSAELHHALESLRESEERFRQLAENCNEVFWMMDVRSARILYLSPTFEPLWGIPVERVYERIDSFLDVVHPEDRDAVRQRLAEFTDIAVSQNLDRQFQYRIVRPTDGEELWLQIRAFPIRDQDGQVYRFGGLIEDITLRKVTDEALYHARQALERRVAERTAELSKSNERLRQEATERERAEIALRNSEKQLRQQFAELEQLYNSAPIGLALHDTALRYVRINARLAAINGHSVADHIGRSVREIVPEISSTVEPLLNHVLETGEPVLNSEVTGSMKTEPDVVRHWMTNYYPLRSSDGEVIGVNAIVQDISERVWAEARARQHLEELAHVSRLTTMGEMAAGIAHELNQPLAAMANFAFIGLHKLGKDSSEESSDLRELFQDLSDQALRAGDIVQRLRDYTRKAPPQRVDVAVNDLIHGVLTLIDAELRLSSVQPQLVLGDSLPKVHANPIQIQQVILNLLRNAVEAMLERPPAKSRLTIATSAPADGVVEVAVSDSGAGINEEHLDRVFDAFFTTKREGMGMGLAISRSIVEDHGGRLWGESVPEGGATFRFTLPTAVNDCGS